MGDGLRLLIGLLVIYYVVCSILIPISIYCAQKWAYKSFKELQKINILLEKNKQSQ